MRLNVARERERREYRYGRVEPTGKIITKWVRNGAFAMFAAGMALGFVNFDVAMWLIVGGMLLAPGAIVVLWIYGRERRDIWGDMWLWFWRSRLGKWTAGLASLGVGPKRKRKLAVPRVETQDAPLRPAEDLRRETVVGMGTWRLKRLQEMLDPRHPVETDGGQLRQRLEDSSAKLNVLLDRIDHHADGAEALTRDFDVMRELCDVVDGLLQVSPGA